MEQLHVRLTGTGPLLMHNIRLANPLDAIAQEMKKITSKRKKTEEDYRQLYWLEFQGGLYYDEKLGPYVPAMNIHAALGEAARLRRKGTDVVRAVQVFDDRNKLEYDGPREPRKMFDKGFVDIRAVSGQGKKGSKTMRSRPIFREWSLACTIHYDPEMVDRQDLLHFLGVAGTLTGLLDGRPFFGKFTHEVLS